MHTKAFLVALTLGANCLAAPVSKNEGTMSTTGFGIHSREDGKVSTTGFGIHSREDGAGDGSRETREARGFGIHSLKSGFGIHSEDDQDASKETQALQKRTGYGIISGNDDA